MAKKQVGKRKKVNKISGILYSSNDVMKVRAKFFNALSPEQIRSSVSTIENHRFFQEIIKPLRNDDFHKIYLPLNPKATFLKNLYWCLGVIELHSNKINNYIDIESKIAIDILNSDFSSALCKVDEIETIFGVTLSTMLIRGGLLSINEDINGLNDLSKKIDEMSKDNDFANAIAKSIISRYEDIDVFMSNIDSFRSQIIRSFRGELLHFLLYKLTLKEPLNVYDYDHILNIEKNSTVLDMYICLMNVIESLCSIDNEMSSHIIYVVSRLKRLVDVPLINNLAHMYGISDDFKIGKKDNHYIELYTRGEYQAIVCLFESDLHFMQDFQYFEIAAKAATRVGRPMVEGLKGQIIDSMISLLAKDESYEKSLSFLLCLCHCFTPIRWFSQLRIFIENEAKELNEHQKRLIRELSILSSNINSPRKLDVLSPIYFDKYLKCFRETVNDSLTLSLWMNRDEVPTCGGELDGVERGRRDKYIALSYLKRKDYSDAIAVLKKLVKTDDILLKNEASKMLIDLYLELNKYDEATLEFVMNCLTNKNLIPYYNSEKICDVLKEYIKSSKSICTPIIYSLHSRFINDKFDSALRFSFESFLMSNDIEDPSFFEPLYLKYEEKLVNYFLEYVCTPDVMKLYLYFDNTKQIENCRIKICKHLIEKEISKDILIYEVKERTKRLVITDAAKHVENSRVYSDTSVFHSEITSDNILNLYHKYIGLSERDYSDTQDEITLQSLYSEFKNSIVSDHAHIVHILDTPLNEKNKCFLSLICLMRDEFCYGDKGLNSYLSTRIRHGHLPTTLRKSVLDEKLVTKRLAKSQAFKKNYFWLEKLAAGDEREEKRLDKIFTEFSSEYEKVISEINDKWIQIYALDQKISRLASQQNKSDGLFNYSISNLESFVIQQRIPIKTEYSEFVKHIVNWLWSRTDLNLKSVREMIDTIARAKLSELLNQLQKDINFVVGGGTMLTEFNDAVGRAKASLSANIEQILSWFERSDESGIENYDIETAIEIAKRSTNVNVEVDLDKQYKLKGNTLTNFVDCFYIFFENAISKSNINKDELQLKLFMFTEEDQVKIKITNKVHQVDDLSQANKSLEIYREKYGQSKIEGSKVQREGGTGFFKIWNIIHNGLGLLHRLNFGFEDHYKFSVELTFFNFEKVIDDGNINY